MFQKCRNGDLVTTWCRGHAAEQTARDLSDLSTSLWVAAVLPAEQIIVLNALWAVKLQPLHRRNYRRTWRLIRWPDPKPAAEGYLVKVKRLQN